MATEPQKLGKYNIVGKIGKGAMGEVYKGHDPVLNRFVAIKIIAETLGTDSDLVERFKREARNAAALNHPNIITIYDFICKIKIGFFKCKKRIILHRFCNKKHSFEGSIN